MTALRDGLVFFLLGAVLGVSWVLLPPAEQSTPRRTQRALPNKVAEQPRDGGGGAAGAAPMRVLFIGNSYIHGHAMPSLIAKLARADGRRPFEFVVDAPGAFTLRKHVSAGRYQQHLASRPFEFVVLQEQSQAPSFSARQRAREMNRPARILHDAIRFSGARTVLFMTWARRDGDPHNTPNDNYGRMQTRVARGYTELEEQLGALLAPVGAVWREVHETRPELTLWMPDGSHPSRAGALLSACVFYSLFYDRPVAELDYDAGVDGSDARYIRETVDRLAPVLGLRAGAQEHAPTLKRRRATTTAPGITLPRDGRCGAGYLPVQGVCYHRRLSEEPARRQQLITAYNRGAVPPLVELDGS